MLVVSAVSLGVSFPYPQQIADNLNFITNGSLALMGLVSCHQGHGQSPVRGAQGTARGNMAGQGESCKGSPGENVM